MKKLFLICFFLSIFFPIIISSQSFEPGFILESSAVFNQKTISYLLKEDIIESTEVNFYPVSIYFSYRLILPIGFSLEVRPGYLFGGKYYSGFELGFFLRYKIIKELLYVAAGLNYHYNEAPGGGNLDFIVSEATVRLWGLSLVVKVSKVVDIMLNIYHSMICYP